MTRLSSDYTKGKIEFTNVELPADLNSYVGISYMLNDLNQTTSYIDHESKFTKLINAISIDWNGAKVPKVCGLFSSLDSPIISHISEYGINDTSEFLYIVDLLVERAMSLRQPRIKNYSNQQVNISINSQQYTISANSELQISPTENTYILSILNNYNNGRWQVKYGTQSVDIEDVGSTGRQLQINSSIKEVSIYGINAQQQYSYKLTNNTGQDIVVLLNNNQITIQNGSTYEEVIDEEHVPFSVMTTFNELYELRIDNSSYNNNGIDSGNHILSLKQILFEYTINPGNSTLPCDNLIVKSANYSGTTSSNVEHKYYKVTSFSSQRKFVLDNNKAIISCSLPANAQSTASWTLGGTIISNSTTHQFNPGTYTLSYNEATQVETYKFYLGRFITTDNQIGISTIPHELTNDVINDIISNITFETIGNEEDIYAPTTGFTPIVGNNGQSYIMRKVPKTQPARLYMIIPKSMLEDFLENTYKNNGFVDSETLNIDLIVDTKNVSTTALMAFDYDLDPVRISRKDFIMDDGKEYSIVCWGRTASEDLVIRNPLLDYNEIFGNNSNS